MHSATQVPLAWLIAALLAVSTLPTSAHAFDPSYYIGLSDSLLTHTRFVTTSQALLQSVNNQVFQEASRIEGERSGRGADVRKGLESGQAVARPGSTLAGRAQGLNVPKRMAANYPEGTREQAEKVFQELLSGYSKVEQQFAIPQNDVAGAVAAYLAGSYVAYRGVDLPDDDFKQLVSQMRGVLSSNPAFAKASRQERRELYENMAIFGMLMATTQMALKERPDAQLAQSMRSAAKAHLEQFLQADADRMEITPQGLVIR